MLYTLENNFVHNFRLMLKSLTQLSCSLNRPYSCSWHWFGNSLPWRLERTSCKLAPVLYREYKYGLLYSTQLNFANNYLRQIQDTRERGSWYGAPLVVSKPRKFAKLKKCFWQFEAKSACCNISYFFFYNSGSSTELLEAHLDLRQNSTNSYTSITRP